MKTHEIVVLRDRKGVAQAARIDGITKTLDEWRVYFDACKAEGKPRETFRNGLEFALKNGRPTNQVALVGPKGAGPVSQGGARGEG